MAKTDPTRQAGKQEGRREMSPFTPGIEHLLDWAEPTIRRVCRSVWGEIRPTGMELADLYQEGRIAVFEAADAVMAADRPRAMVATVVRRQAYDAVRVLSDRGSRSRRTDGRVEAMAAG